MSSDLGISLRIKELIDSRFNGNRTKFGQYVGVGESALRSYEAGVVPKADVIIKISTALAVSCDWLLLGKEKEEYDGEMEDIQELIDKLTQYKNKLEKKSNKK